MDNDYNMLSSHNVQLPQSKIRKICRLVAPTATLSSEAVQTLTIGAVFLLNFLVKINKLIILARIFEIIEWISIQVYKSR